MDTSLHNVNQPGQRIGQAPDHDTQSQTSAARHAHIIGWGADLERENRPAVPKERRPARLGGLHWSEVEPQHPNVEVLHSTERPGLTPVFGAGQPPSGLSGGLRRVAFGYSENDLRHWLLLLMADRINVLEGLFGDIARGHVPNVYAEMGGRAELRHNPAGAARKGLMVVAAVGLGYWAWKRRNSQRR